MHTLLILALFAPPQQLIHGKVVSVHDGDTITVVVDKTQIKVRLEGIDAPESTQPFGTRSKRALSEKVFGKQVTIEWTEKDRFGRTLGRVMLDGRWINKDMVTEGFAWHYKQYSSEKELSEAEEEAKKAKAGLWSDPNARPPWEFREGAKRKKAA